MVLDQLEATLKKQWRLGQSIVLCCAFDTDSLLTIVISHDFLGNFKSPNHVSGEGLNNGDFIRQLISGSRFKAHDEIFENAGRCGAAPSFIKLDSPLHSGEASIQMIDEMIKRYNVGHEESRAVALFDIVDFSLYRLFEQASQLNSLSYSMNPICSRLKREGVEINFARTTTGDGYYVWNRDLGAFPNLDLLTFFLLVLIDSAVAREKSQVGTVPTLRSAFHIGSHYVLSQAEGINPTVFSYIVGDVRIKLARSIEVTHKHDMSQGAQNVGFAIGLEGLPLALGMRNR